LRNKTVVLT